MRVRDLMFQWPVSPKKSDFATLADALSKSTPRFRTGGSYRAGSSYHCTGPARDISPATDWKKMRKALEGLNSTYRTAAYQMRAFFQCMKTFRLFPEFRDLDTMRWTWPTWRVQERPFDHEVDAGPQRGPNDLVLGRVRWFS